MKVVFYVKVGGRTFEATESAARRDELLKILPGMYPGRRVTVVTKKEIKVKVNYEATFTYSIGLNDEFDPDVDVDLDMQDIGTGGDRLIDITDVKLDAYEVK